MSRIAAALLALALAAAALILPTAVLAAPTEGGEVTWSVEPVPNSQGPRQTFEYGVDPGTQIVDSVVITNAGETATDFLVYATDAINQLDTGAFGLLERDDEPTDVGGWIELAESEITLQPGTQATVPFNLLVPSDAAPGEHVAGIVASVLTTGENEEGAAVTLEQRVGARVYLDVTGAEIAEVEIAGLTSAFSPSLNPFGGGDLALSFDLRNTGNQRLDVSPTVTVAGPFGIPLAELEVDPLHELLPRQTVRMTTELPAIAALALLWSTVTVVPGPVGSAADTVQDDPASTTTPTATPSPTPTESAAPEPSASAAAEDGTTVQDIVVTDEELSFEPVSETTLGFAISWTLLAVVIALVLLVYLVWRYISTTRERMYLAIDEAAEAARQEAITAGEDPK